MKNRRQFIKKAGIIGLAANLPTFTFHISKRLPLEKEVIGHGKFKYRVERDWAKLNPSNSPVINCHEMVMDKKKRLIMVTDHPKNNVLILDKSGRLLDAWTLGFKGTHGLTIVDEGGEEFLFITDPNSGMVVKTNLSGKILMTIDPVKEGLYQSKASFRPTETAIAPNGDIYVISVPIENKEI